jgi:hypothetical protein
MLLIAHFLQNVSSYCSQNCDDVCFQQFQFEISTDIKAVKVHILFVKHNISFTTVLPPARLSVDSGTCDQQEVTDDILELQ